MPQLAKLDCKYGAPMGRCNQPNEYSGYQAIPDMPHKFTLQTIRLNAGGYDSGGAYWGHGPRLYWATNENETIERFFRAMSRAEAKATLRREFPNCTFYR